MFNKRGQELSVNTLILIIIGVLILVFLIVGFTVGWKKIFPFITPQNNVKEVVDKCSLACNTGAKYDFCSAKRNVAVDTPIARLGNNKKEFSATCYELTLLKDELGIEDCVSIQCEDAAGAYSYSADFKTLGEARTSARESAQESAPAAQ